MKCFGKRMYILLLIFLLTLGCLGCQREKALRVGDQKVSVSALELDLSGKPLPAVEELEGLKALTALEKLDLRGTEATPEQYAAIREMLPQCQILWEIPVDGRFHDPETRELTLSALREEDLEALGFFSSLESIILEVCPEPEVLTALRELQPGCNLRYTVELDGEQISSDTVSLSVSNADPAVLRDVLSLLPNLTEVRLEGAVPEKAALLSLAEQFPGIHFLCSLDLFGRKLSTDAVELDLSGIPMTGVEEVEEILPLFPMLEKVIMCDCGIPSEEMDALWKRNPDVRFVWSVKVGTMTLRTDMTVLMPYQYGYTPGTILHYSRCEELKYMVDIVCLDLGHMLVEDVFFVAYMPNLEYLLLCDNRLTDISPLAGLQKLKYVELFANSITDFSVLATCPALEDVNICYSTVDDIAPLLEIKNLKNLWVSSHKLTADQRRQLEEGLPEDVNLVMDSSAISGGWRQLPNYYAQRDLLGMPYFNT